MLIVEDVTATRELLTDFVRRKGFHVLAAGDGHEALALLRAAPSQVCAIVLDLQMQPMDGFAFREEQLAEPALAAIPVIVLTSTGRETTLRYTLQTPHVILKPTVVDQLEQALAECCA